MPTLGYRCYICTTIDDIGDDETIAIQLQEAYRRWGGYGKLLESELDDVRRKGID